MRNPVTLILTAISTPVILAAQTVQRFPRPDFESDYSAPLLTAPAARWFGWEYLDVLLLILALALAGHLALRRRSRRGLLALAVFSLLYFGFWRQGCICAVGASQNVTAAWFQTEYLIPLPVLAFFALPLLFTLFHGRTFCAAVCPLGAIQELTVWRPVKLPLWLNHTLGMLPWVYLCLALLFAATGTGFLICRWDPFVGFFRLGAPLSMLLFGALILAVGLFVARPYCRFLCPYGVLLGLCSRLARRHVTITPAECVQCRLCEDACPFGAIQARPGVYFPATGWRGTTTTWRWPCKWSRPMPGHPPD
ncbi:MAG: 4Fe-4S binding protein [Lentisphaerae bacterium]|nr:4Fe-4S binding protein [Lentisphaerota bacterium]